MAKKELLTNKRKRILLWAGAIVGGLWLLNMMGGL